MRSFVTLASVAAYAFRLVFAGTTEPIRSEFAPLLSKEDLENLKRDGKTVMASYRIHWCGYCKQTDPWFQKMSKFFQDKPNSKMVVGIIDCGVHPNLCNEHQIRGYPTYRIFPTDGEAVDYAKPTDEKSMFKYLRRLEGTGCYPVDKVPDYVDTGDVNFGYFHATFPKESSEFELYKKISESLKTEHYFAYSFDPKQSFPMRLCFVHSRFGEKEMKSDDSGATESSLRSFIADAAVPLVDEIGSHNYALYEQSKKPIVFYFDKAAKKDESILFLEKVAGEFAKEFNLVFINDDQYGGYKHTLNLGIKSNSVVELPAVSVHDIANQLKWALPKRVESEGDLRSFLKGIISKAIEPTFKSQPIPNESSSSEPIKKVVCDNFRRTALDCTTWSLLLVFSEFCGACRYFDPVINAFASNVKSKNVSFFKIDGNENDLPWSNQVVSFPTLYLISPHNESQAIVFEGDRTLSELLKFVRNKVPDVEFDLSAAEKQLEADKSIITEEASGDAEDQTTAADSTEDHDDL